MLNIASIQPVSWPTPPSQAVAPVAGVAGVSPTQRSGEEGRPGYGSGSDGRPKASPDGEGGRSATQKKAATQSEGAPLLPRKRADGEASMQTRLPDTNAAKERSREAELAEQTRSEQKQNLLEVLSTVWKASAAVVEVALGRAGKIEAASQGDALPPGAPQVKNVDSKGVDLGLGKQAVGASPGEGLNRPEGEPIAYTEQGESAWVPLEPGKFVDQSV